MLPTRRIRRPAAPGRLRRVLAPAALAIALLVSARAAPAAPWEFLPVGDPLEAELRALDVLGPAPLAGRVRLPHLSTRPLQLGEIEGAAAPPESLDRARAISLARLERVLGRHATASFAPDPRWPPTPWAFRRVAASGDAAELSVGVEGALRGDEDSTVFTSGSGLHARVGLHAGGWTAWSHLLLGQVDRARSFADPLIPNNDLVAFTEDTWVGYSPDDTRWAAWLGRSRWHWGPGEEGSLTLSETSPALTAVAFRVRLEPLRADAVALSATLDPGAGRQLAAHRVEWQPSDAWRLGLTETATYRADGWHPLYLVGAIPYILVQRLEWQDSADSMAVLRNNVMVAADAAWRLRPGTRVYGELLIDDLHAKTGRNPNKWGWQAGWDGVGTLGRTRVTWGGEYTRLSRYVYTSFFGQSYSVHGEPIGFPTGPDVARLRLRAAWDLSESVQLLARATHTDKGENELDEPFVPGVSPSHPAVMTFEGVVERTRTAELGARVWPAGGVDLAGWVGARWIEAQDHIAGRDNRSLTGAIELRLQR